MAEGGKTKWVFDLDVKDATEKVLNLQGSIEKLGSEESVKGLIEGLTKVGGVVGIVGAAIFALKTTMDLVFEGENIKAINSQFEMLAKNSGIAGDAMKEAMVKAAGGLIDDTDLLKIANESMVKMGNNARRLPEVMELARKTTAVFGGELKDNFEQLSTALANGNARMLKHLGIKVDLKKAEQDYAKSIGTTVDLLSESGKQAALMEAAIKKSQSAFAGVDTDIRKSQNALQEIKVTISQIFESFVTVFEKTMGPILTKAFKGINEMMKGIKTEALSLFGDWGENSEVAQAKIETLTKSLERNRREADALAQQKLNGLSEQSYQDAKKKLDLEQLTIEAEINGLKAKKTQIEETAEAQKKLQDAGALGGQDSQIDRGAAAAKQAAFEKSLAEMHAKTLEMSEKSAEDVETVEQIHWQRKMQLLSEQATFEQKLRTDVAEGKILQANADQLIAENREQTNIKLSQMDDELEKKRIDALERYAEHNKNTAKGFSGAWAAETAKAGAASKNFAKLGQFAFGSLKSHAVDAFKAVGAGSKNMADAMKDAILGTIGDVAIAQGSEMLMQGIGTMNPIMATEGAGLIALGGYLQSQSGGGEVSASSGGGGGYGGGSYGGSDTTGRPASDNPAVATPQKAVTIQVQGHYFETEQTKTALIDMIKAANDATDYSFKQIGQ